MKKTDIQPEAQAILEPAGTRVRDPRTGRSLWMADILSDGSLTDDTLKVTMCFHPDHSETQMKGMQQSLLTQIDAVGWKGNVECSVTVEESLDPKKNNTSKKSEPVKGMSGGGMGPHGGPIQKQPIPGVKHIIAIASGKGGVGKSTVSVNIAVALAKKGYNIGLIDADVHGPSLPMMMNVSAKPIANDEQQIIPISSYGVKCISMGLLVEKDEPIIWRGPMVMGVIRQFFQTVAWGELDYLIVDLPPGTGDAQLTMVQAVELSGAVIVTTPQAIAVQDAIRGVEMFKKLDVPILGIVENMSFLKLPDGSLLHPFGQGGGFETALRYKVPLLAQLPLDERIRLGGDMGTPVALSDEDCGQAFREIADSLHEHLST